MKGISVMSKNTHLTLIERCLILTGITNNHTKADIAKSLNVDKSTIGKEIKLHRKVSHFTSLSLECANYKTCKHSRVCFEGCPDYIKFTCKRRDRSPGVCNGCSNMNYCRFTKYKYDPYVAQNDYKETLISSREGVNLTYKEAKELASIIVPLIKNGQSPYQVINDNKSIKLSEKTLYNYIENNVFKDFGLTNLDLRRQVSRKLPKRLKTAYKKRKDNKYLINRKYSDYLNYISNNPSALVVQMDTVYNDVTNGPFIQTFKFMNCSFMFAILHEKKDSKSMIEGINLLQEILGLELFKTYVNVILTDRGTEFIDATNFENDKNGNQRTLIFYCDPMCSHQKGSLENNHEELRYICPKEKDLFALGLTSQEALNIALSHINSASKEKLQGKSPIELMNFFYPNLWKKFESFGIRFIEKDKILLKPSLLKDYQNN